jgi:hypothetical protein
MFSVYIKWNRTFPLIAVCQFYLFLGREVGVWLSVWNFSSFDELWSRKKMDWKMKWMKKIKIKLMSQTTNSKIRTGTHKSEIYYILFSFSIILDRQVVYLMSLYICNYVFFFSIILPFPGKCVLLFCCFWIYFLLKFTVNLWSWSVLNLIIVKF